MDFIEKILDASLGALATLFASYLPKIIQRLKTNPHPQIQPQQIQVNANETISVREEVIHCLKPVYGSAIFSGTATLKCIGTVTEPVWFDGIGDKS